jgi:hypothetical protein
MTRTGERGPHGLRVRGRETAGAPVGQVRVGGTAGRRRLHVGPAQVRVARVLAAGQRRLHVGPARVRVAWVLAD